MAHLISKSSILNRVYLLITLIVLTAILVTSALLSHSREQQLLIDKVSNFHDPSIYYAAKLTETLQEIAQSFYSHQQHQTLSKKRTFFSTSVVNPLYSIKNTIKAIKDLDSEKGNQKPNNALLRLERDINYLVEILNEFSLAQDDQIELLPDLIQSAKFRAQQFSRLHLDANDKLRQKITLKTQDNTKILIAILISTAVIGFLIVFPLVLSIRKMINEMYDSETLQRELKDLAKKEKSRLAALLSAMNFGILFEDKQNCVEYFNPAFKNMWALGDDIALIGQSLNQLLGDSPEQLASPEHSSKYVLQVLDTHEISERFEINFKGGRVLAQLSYPVLDNEMGVLGRLWIYEDITNDQQTAQQLLYLAEHDHLTGLFNRHLFQQRLTYMVDSYRRSGGKFTLLYFDLDEFKYINDTFGHGAGDSILLRTASEVSHLVRGSEIFARLGGDEFAILTTLGPQDNMDALPDRLINAISSIPFRFRGTNLRLTASLGIAIFPDHGDNEEDLVSHADTAMYQAKKMGKNTWSIYNPERDDSELMVERMSWSRRIGLALEQDLLKLHFQGIYNTDDQELSHLEVLVRMNDPADNSRIIMPNAFIPFAEKTAQIIEIDRCVLAKSIAVLAQYPDLPGLAVNISGRSFDEPSLPSYIRNQLIAYTVDPGRLLIELTETETVADIQDAQRFIEAIYQTGCRICLDDFGSGFSTFTYLKYLNVQILKIDGMFIKDLVNNHENKVFVKAMISIAQGLNKSVVAEFVENVETLDLLKSYGVQFVQGYYLDKPTEQHKAFL